MDEIVVALRRARTTRALVPLFLVSGATSLVYQTVWNRQLHLVFGTSTLAAATVLAAFMGGLAVGGALGARLVDRTARPLAVYGVLEIGIGLWALAFPWLLDAVQPAYIEVVRAADLDAAGRAGLQLAVVGVLLLPPTAAMGATLPLLARVAAARVADAGARIGALYAANTAGALLGTALAGFVLLPSIGLWATTAAVASANAVLGVVAIAIDRGSVPLDPAPPGPSPMPSPAAPAAVWAAGIAGFTGLVAEVAWFRVLSLNLGASTYAFTLMLLAFLGGIAAGGAVGGRWGDARLARGGLPAVLTAFAGTQAVVALTTVGALYLSTSLPTLYVVLFDAFRAVRDPATLWTVQWLVATLLLLPSTVAMGVAFPLAVRAAVGRPDAVGAAVGRVYAANTAGGVIGAALAGFVLLPTLGVRGTVALAVAGSLGAAGVALGGLRALGVSAVPPARAVGAVAAAIGGLWVAVPPVWDPLLVTAGMYKYVADLGEASAAGIEAFAKAPYRLLFYAEGPSTVVTAAQDKDSGNVWLANNGKVDASTTVDMPTQLLVSLLPLMVADQRNDVLLIGLASGISAGAITLVPDVDRLTVVELEPATARAARLFDAYNFGVLDDPRLTLVFDDGRNHVVRAPEASYDVIVSEPSNPWITGVSNLFTADFFRLAKARLRPGGVWGQWVQLYGMDDDDLRTLLGTFSDVFPYVEVWSAAEDADLVLLGSDRPLDVSVARVEALRAIPGVRAALDGIDMDTVGDVLAQRMMGTDAVRALSEGAPRNTDDNMRIEYRAPRNLHRGTTLDNSRLLDRHATLPLALVGEDALLWEDVAHGLWRREEETRAVEALVRSALLVDPEDPARAVRLDDAFRWWMLEVPVPPDRRPALEARFVREVVEPLLAAP